MATPSRMTITESGRDLGWSEDRELLRSLSDEGWDPRRFDFDNSGLVISFECQNLGTPSEWEYDCNQEGGTSVATIGTLKYYAESHGLEIIFVYRVGTQGAERQGGYTRFYCRRPRTTDNPRWKFPFEYCGVVAGEIVTGFEQVQVERPPTTHPKEWELIGTVRSWNEADWTFNGRRLRIYKRPSSR